MGTAIWQKISVSFILMSFLMGVPKAQAFQSCTCIADPFSKKYIYFQKTWYGSKRSWTCMYSCQDLQQRRLQILGTHKDWYTTDNGLEGICDGLHYVNIYNTHRAEFVWKFDSARWFDPGKATAPELKSWAAQNCR